MVIWYWACWLGVEYSTFFRTRRSHAFIEKKASVLDLFGANIIVASPSPRLPPDIQTIDEGAMIAESER